MRHADPEGGIIVSGPITFCHGDRREVVVIKWAYLDLEGSFGPQFNSAISMLDRFLVSHQWLPPASHAGCPVHPSGAAPQGTPGVGTAVVTECSQIFHPFHKGTTLEPGPSSALSYCSKPLSDHTSPQSSQFVAFRATRLPAPPVHGNQKGDKPRAGELPLFRSHQLPSERTPGRA